MANKTLIFTTTDVIKCARKVGRENQDVYGIDKMSDEQFQNLSDEVNHLTKTFFNLARTTEHPEQEFLRFTLRGMKNADENTTKTACMLIYFGALGLVEQKVEDLQSCRDLKDIYNTEALDWWRRYEKIRLRGDYNMITEAILAAEAAGLTVEQYKYVTKNYTDLQAAVIMDNALSEPAPF